MDSALAAFLTDTLGSSLTSARLNILFSMIIYRLACWLPPRMGFGMKNVSSVDQTLCGFKKIYNHDGDKQKNELLVIDLMPPSLSTEGTTLRKLQAPVLTQSDSETPTSVLVPTSISLPLPLGLLLLLSTMILAFLSMIAAHFGHAALMALRCEVSVGRQSISLTMSPSSRDSSSLSNASSTLPSSFPRIMCGKPLARKAHPLSHLRTYSPWPLSS